MESLLILIGIGLFVLVAVLPIAAIITASKARREAERLGDALREQQIEFNLLKRRVDEGASRPAPEAAPPPPRAEAPAPAKPAAAPAPSAAFSQRTVDELTAPAAEPPPSPPPPPVVPAAPLVPPAPELPAFAKSVALDAPTPAVQSPVTPPPLPAFAMAAAMADAKAEAAAHAPRPAAVPTPPPVPPAATRPTVPPPPPEKPFNWEQFLGVKGLAWAAGIAFLFGAIYFLKYSIDAGWIPLEVRIASVFVAGAGLIVGGVWSDRRGFRATGQSLVATGVVVLYAVTFACRSLYKEQLPLFDSAITTFAFMALITSAAFVLAVRLRAQVVAILGLLGGFLTPVMLSTGQDNPLGLFGYLTLLDVGLLAVALRCRWHHLVALAAIGTAVMEVGWASEFFSGQRLDVAFAIVAWFAVLFPSAVAVARRWTAVDDWLAGSALLPPLVAGGFALFFLFDQAAVAQPGWVFSTILVADLAVLALGLLHRPIARFHLAAGPIAMALTALWTGVGSSAELLPWALGFVLLLAGLHVGFPFLLQRVHPDATTRSSCGLFPLTALVVLLVPVLLREQTSTWLWPVALVLNLLAIAAAALSGLLAALAGAVLLTLLLLGCAILRMPPPVEAGASLELWLVAGFALLFCTASVWLVRIWFARPDVKRGNEPAWLDHLPSLSAALPFALLVMLVFKLRLPDPSEVFGVGLLLTALLLGLATIARQGALAVVALLGVLLVEFAWHGERFHHGGAQGVALSWYLAFAAAFTAFPFVFRRRVLDLQGPCAASALALPLHFVLIYGAINALWPNEVHGLIALVAAVPLLAALLLVLRWVPADAPYRLNRIAWFGGAALFFLTLVFPLQFSNQWLTVSWALEGVALLWLFHRVPHPGLRLVGVGLLCAVFARLMFNAELLAYAVRSDTPIFNWILYTYGIASACCFVAARLLAPPRDLVIGVRAPAVLQVLGTILAFALVNLEIADFFTPPGSRVEVAISGNFARDMTFPIAWAGFAVTLLYLGIRQQMKWVRTIAALLLAAVFLRLLLNFDLFGCHRGAGLAAWMLTTYGVVSVACFLAAHWFAPLEEDVLGIPPVATLRVLGTILVFLLLNLQIAGHYTVVGRQLDLEFSGNFARDMTYTIAWALFALTLLIIGIFKRVTAARWAALVLLGITLLKLFLHDLSRLETIYKVGALMGVAVVAFAASFLFQRFFGKEKDSQ